MKKLTFLLALGMAVLFGAQQAKAATVDLSTLTADYVAQNGDTLTGSLSAKVKISVAKGASVTLMNARIYGTNSSSYMFAGITCNESAFIFLVGANVVRGFYEQYPGIYIASGKRLTIYGDGSLTVSSNGAGAAIGGGQDLNCGDIFIHSGTIDATGGYCAAAIGGGRYASCGQIDIAGGYVYATGGNNAPGIGSGESGSCGNINISRLYKSSLHVESSSGSFATNSVGAGNKGSCGIITVGEDSYPTGTSLTTNPFTFEQLYGVDLGKLTANYYAKNGDVLTGTLKGPYDIFVNANSSVTLDHVVIDPEIAGFTGPGIFCLGLSAINLVGTNIVKGSSTYSGIYFWDGKLTITGSGSLEVTGGDNGAGIGSSDVNGASCGDIIIKSGTITATGGKNAAGIGCGSRANCGNITIEGGKVTAIKGEGALCSIGKGGNSSATTGTITIGRCVYPDGIAESPYVGPKWVYTVFDGVDKLTYFYNDQYNASNANHELYNPIGKPTTLRWKTYHGKIKTVVVDASMQNAPLTSMYRMFYGGNATNSGTTTHYSLYNVETITGLENLDTKNVTSMRAMFNRLHSLKSIDLSTFNTAKVANMAYMFVYCKALTSIDLTSFNTANDTTTQEMFTNCTALKTIYCEDDWSSNTKLVNSSKMFSGCTALVGGNGTKYDDTIIDATYARPDEEGQKGYFSKKSSTGMEEVSHQPSAVSCQKVIRDGQLYLMYEGRMYDVRGQKVK